MLKNVAKENNERKIRFLNFNDLVFPAEKIIALKITFAYIFFGLLWVLLKGMFFWGTDLEIQQIQYLHTLASVLSVLGTGMILFFLLRRELHLLSKLKNMVTLRTQQGEIIIENLTDGLWQYDLNTHEAYISSKCKESIRYNNQEFLCTSEIARSLFHPDDYMWFQKELSECLQKNLPSYETELRIKTGADNYQWFMVRVQALYDQQGLPAKLIGTIININIRKLAEEAITKNEKKFRKLFHNANDLIFLYQFPEDGTPGKYIEVNDIACQRLGYHRNELLAMTPSDLTSPNQVPEGLETLKKLLHHDHITFETVLVTKYGQQIPYENSAHFFTLNGERVVLSISRDITERKRAEAQLKNIMNQNQKLLKETLEYDALKTEFFSNISHEFKTPLNVILGALQLIYTKQGNGPDQNCMGISRDLNIIKQNCFRLLRLINNLIDITRVDTGFMKVQFENQNIVAIVEDITLSVAEFIEIKGITLEFDTDMEEKIIACDADKIERIMLNLLSNAVKHTQPGGRIMVNILAQERDVQITVADTGRGIPIDKQKIIFERFRQANPLLNRTHEGSGIGLSLVKSFVEMHKGKILVDSKEGIGSQFIVTLPGDSIQGETASTTMHTDFDSSKVEKIRIEFSDIYS
ncbi:sensor histidine kinase [Anaerosolibacter sp.]|uniref:sensor histidine kinase n=1 Tax=Anaerosolibacter sp. TaxID=1872527 RepID=UPI0039EEDD6F